MIRDVYESPCNSKYTVSYHVICTRRAHAEGPVLVACEQRTWMGSEVVPAEAFLQGRERAEAVGGSLLWHWKRRLPKAVGYILRSILLCKICSRQQMLARSGDFDINK